jgi:ABC-type transporter lipoprotein component MlaA
MLYGGTSGLSTRERHLAELKDLEGSSIDFYAALRSAYYQNRVDEIWGRRDQHRTREEPGLVAAAGGNGEGVSTD